MFCSAEIGSGCDFRLRPSSCVAKEQRVAADSSSRRDFLDRKLLALELISAGVLEVASLLKRRGPSAVVRRVSFRAINAVDRFAFWLRPHVRIKIREIAPALADLDAARAVPAVALALRVVAALRHLDPYGVLLSLRHAVFDGHVSIPAGVRAVFPTALGKERGAGPRQKLYATSHASLKFLSAKHHETIAVSQDTAR